VLFFDRADGNAEALGDFRMGQKFDFAQQQRFERMGVFTYSFEPDTPAV